jgi:calcium-translocating P-type ATPase
LVPGDVVLLEAGQVVPADLRFTACHGLRMQEAALTGESLDTVKQPGELEGEDLPLGDRGNMGFKGTVVAKGRGEGIVVATGMRTEMGRIAKLLDQGTAATPLQKRMAAFGKVVAVAVLAICAVLFTVGWLRGGDPLTLLLTSISLAVAAIPEALPALMSVSLALSAARMVKQQALVRRLAAVETLGSVTVICTDKTGTLTRNRMRVEELVVLDEAQRSRLLQAMTLSNDVMPGPDGPVGEGTELALFEHAEVNGAIKAETEQQLPRMGEVPFDAVRKCMSTIHRLPEGRHLLFIKGALEALWERVPSPDPRWRTEADRLAAEGLRVMALGWRELPPGPLPDDPHLLEREITLLGLAGIQDPPRDEVPQAIAACQAAGIRIVMITGDHPVTARTIARRIGLLSPVEADDPRSVITGAELARLDAKALRERVDHLRVIARVSPEQKLDIVAALQEHGHFVAMTGDGVNDAPALKAADIGVAMGQKGTDAAREASDLVLTDDNFATIARAVREGRVVFDNIKKSLLFILPTNGGEAGVILLAVFAGLALPVTAGQILWVNMVTTVTLALSLAFESAETGVMDRPPRRPTEALITPLLAARIAYVSLLMIAVTFTVFEWELARGASIETARTAAVNMLVVGELVYLFNVRSFTASALRRDILWGNRVALWMGILLIGLQALFTYAPPLQKAFQTTALDASSWLLIALLGAAKFLAVEAEKAVLRRMRLHWM